MTFLQCVRNNLSGEILKECSNYLLYDRHVEFIQATERCPGLVAAVVIGAFENGSTRAKFASYELREESFKLLYKLRNTCRDTQTGRCEKQMLQMLEGILFHANNQLKMGLLKGFAFYVRFN